MPNYAFLSLWFRDFTIEKGLAHLEALLTLFPLSPARPGFRLLIRSLDEAQSPTLEAELLAAPGAVQKLAAQFLHDDTAYEVTAYWDLWQARPNAGAALDFQQAPSAVEFTLQGEAFDNARYRESGHVAVNLGPELLYLGPADIPWETHHRYTRENVRRLYAYLRQVEKSLPIAERRLWSEGEVDFPGCTEEILARS